MVNSGIGQVAVLTCGNAKVLLEHLGTGREWELDRKRGGLSFLPPGLNDELVPLKGDIHNFYRHREYFDACSQEYVIVAPSHVLCNVDFRAIAAYHKETGADVTVLYKETEMSSPEYTGGKLLVFDGPGKVDRVEAAITRPGTGSVFAQIFMIRRQLLMEIVRDGYRQGQQLFIQDALLERARDLRIYGLSYTGYLGMFTSVESYYRHSMRIIDPAVWKELFTVPGRIHTKMNDDPPAQYREGSAVRRSLIANGVTIEGEVENSILFRGVNVKPGARVRNSIILENCVIGPGADLDRVILEAKSSVGAGAILCGGFDQPLVSIG
jgi:glucose-1-phosphate adenylyltransferase